MQPLPPGPFPSGRLVGLVKAPHPSALMGSRILDSGGV